MDNVNGLDGEMQFALEEVTSGANDMHAQSS